MTRKKVKLAYITNDSARKATYKKRKKGLMKKVSELSTLCGIDACAIIYSPYETQPEVWPNTAGAQRIISQFRRMPEMEQSKKMVNQESFIRQRIAKATEQLKKQQKENREKEITEVMYQCLTGKGLQGMTMPDLNDLGWLLDQKLKDIYKRVDSLKKNTTMVSDSLQQQMVAAGQPVAAPPLPPPPPPPVAVPVQENKPASVELGMDNGVSRPQWLVDWMNNPNEQNLGFGNGPDEMILPFPDNTNTMWSSAFFP